MWYGGILAINDSHIKCSGVHIHLHSQGFIKDIANLSRISSLLSMYGCYYYQVRSCCRFWDELHSQHILVPNESICNDKSWKGYDHSILHNDLIDSMNTLLQIKLEQFVINWFCTVGLKTVHVEKNNWVIEVNIFIWVDQKGKTWQQQLEHITNMRNRKKYLIKLQWPPWKFKTSKPTGIWALCECSGFGGNRM